MEEVKIGAKIWMAKNLSIGKFRNGDIIPIVETDEDWEDAGNNAKPACCYYENSTENGLEYGLLYNWFALMDSRNLAPEGWIIPTINDWKTLIDFLGGSIGNGIKLKSVNNWKLDDKYKFAAGTNEFNFCGLPSGYRSYDGLFDSLTLNCTWWCSDEDETDNEKAKTVLLDFHLPNITHGENYKGCGFSIRCIKN